MPVEFSLRCKMLIQVINVAPKGAQILPIGVNVNPAVVLINPQGYAVWVSTQAAPACC